jgi:hypothetical protein
MTAPDGDASGNYTELMRERGWDWGDLADHFARQATQPQLDGGASYLRLERWARGEHETARLRAHAAADRAATDGAPRPDDAQPNPDPRKVVPPKKRTA